jgi:hypothetical protein
LVQVEPVLQVIPQEARLALIPYLARLLAQGAVVALVAEPILELAQMAALVAAGVIVEQEEAEIRQA